jgi:hypothetical protein
MSRDLFVVILITSIRSLLVTSALIAKKLGIFYFLVCAHRLMKNFGLYSNAVKTQSFRENNFILKKSGRDIL